jgi:chemotaxis protein MotB|tara:strand:- start:11098 stop:12180 length:1083 start_codon:yes stop_codon:yes gene_type:complete
MAADVAFESEITIEVPPARIRPCPRCRQVAPGWMTTFADMATLLMALFALMYNFAQMDQREKAIALGSLNAAFGATVIVPVIEIPVAESFVISDLISTSDALKKLSQEELIAIQTEKTFTELKKSLAPEIKEGQVVVRVQNDKIVVELQSFTAKDQATQDYYLTQSVLGITEKVVTAQATTSTEIEVRKQDLAALEALKERRRQDAKSKYDSLSLDLQDNIARGEMTLVLKDENLVIRLSGEGSFISGSDKLQPSFKALITKIGEKLISTKSRIRIEGHTDNIKITFSERFMSNWDLSSARSSSVAAVLIKDLGINFERIAVAGFADSVPLESNESATGRALNRRIEIIVKGSSEGKSDE